MRILAVSLGVFWCLPALCGADTPNVDFNRDIKPLLSDRCFTCHGPDANQRQADLRLDTKAGAFAESQTGEVSHVIKPGAPDESELVRRIVSTDADLRMPPAESNLSLSSQEVELLKSWIRQGAKWQEHWAFEAPRDVQVPVVKNARWPRNEIDRFILRRLEAAGVPPSEEATRERLLRRVTFDLTGLPPTLEELDAFLADTSEEAYEKVVDRLLKSPRYGERMTAAWLDVARYSDTYGYQVDRDRFVWPWRDWVIRTFNRNLPYDEFVTQQLAGDLLPNATEDTKLATTFNRLHPQKVEGGSVPEEFRVEYVADRTQTFATAFLGLTLECARCHDHKYDPLTQKEYYQFYAFFNNIDEAGLYSYFTPAVPTPTLRLMDEAKREQHRAAKAQVATAENSLNQARKAQTDAFKRWLATRNDVKAEVAGRVAHLDFETQSGPNAAVPGRVGKAAKLTGDDGIGLKVGNFKRYEPFSVSLWMNTPDKKERAVVFHRSRAWTDAGSRGYQLLIEDGRLSFSLIHFWPGNALRVRTRDVLPVKQWQHVTVAYDGSSRAAGVRFFVNGQPAAAEVVRDNLYKHITGGGGDNIVIGERFRDRGFTGGLVDEFQVFDRELTALEAAHLHDGRALADALATHDDKLSSEDREQLRAFYLSLHNEAAKKHRDALQKHRQQLCQLEDGLQEIMTMEERKHRRPTFLLKRGAYDAPGDSVKPATPAVFPSFNQPANRLGLAKWLTDAKHPLAARVAVNQFWQLIFGHGLVRTPEDFGSQGKRPTHPDLLDWLARDFVAHGWNVKRLLKQMAMSSAYRQSSRVTKDMMARDPENLLLNRAASFRMEAEMLRDNALAASGLLSDALGGPPAKPYEVEASFKPAKRDSGPGLYRRSVYTYWKRTGPAPVMMTLDASKRDVCRVKRERTSSPLQAFVLMNGPQIVEAARVLSVKLATDHGENTADALREMFRRLTSRRPTERELAVVTKLFQTQLANFESHPDRAKAYLKTGDAKADVKIPPARLAALAVVANTLFNFDECVTRR